MAYEVLQQRIQELWDRASAQEGKRLSERQLCIRAGVGVKTLFSLRHGHAPKPATLSKLADYFGVPRDYLTSASAMDSSHPPLSPSMTLETVFIRGAVQAGEWRTALEWESSDWYAVQIPRSRRYSGNTRFGLEVRGSSMDRFYPEHTVVLAIKFFDLSQSPKTGDHVIVKIRDPNTGDFEATIKEYEFDEKGRHILWPRSTDPQFQSPIILGSGDLIISEDDHPTKGHVSATMSFEAAGLGDIEVWALVVGSYTERL